MQWLIAEIKSAKKKADKKGHAFSVRLNGTSDIDLRQFTYNGLNILEIFPQIQFYDYTKVPKRLKQFEKYANYHLTLSFSGYNMADCINALLNGHNVAVVFENKLPSTFKGFNVINGDLYDLRYRDPKGTIVGLKFKTVKTKVDTSNNAFIIPYQHTDSQYAIAA